MSQQEWFMAIGGHQVGPVTHDDVVTNIRNGTVDGSTLVFKAGMSNWTPLKDVPQLAAFLTHAAGGAAAAPPPPAVPDRRAHDIDFRILGSEMQFVEVELDPGESAVAGRSETGISPFTVVVHKCDACLRGAVEAEEGRVEVSRAALERIELEAETVVIPEPPAGAEEVAVRRGQFA